MWATKSNRSIYHCHINSTKQLQAYCPLLATFIDCLLHQVKPKFHLPLLKAYRTYSVLPIFAQTTPPSFLPFQILLFHLGHWIATSALSPSQMWSSTSDLSNYFICNMQYLTHEFLLQDNTCLISLLDYKLSTKVVCPVHFLTLHHTTQRRATTDSTLKRAGSINNW